MLSTERTEFEAHLAVLFGGWPQSLLTQERKEAYWRGLEQMRLGTFARCVNAALGEQGPAKLPTVNDLWQLSKSFRATVPNTQTSAAPPFEPIHAHANKCLLAWLMRHREQVADGRLNTLVATKNRVADKYKLVFEEDKTLTGSEIRDALFRAFDAATAQQRVAA